MTVSTVLEALKDKGMDTLHTIAASAMVEAAVELMAAQEIGAVVVARGARGARGRADRRARRRRRGRRRRPTRPRAPSSP